MQQVVRFLLCFLGIGICMIPAVFFSLTLYYRNNFPVNTWINGIYCTGKTVEQVNKELVEIDASHYDHDQGNFFVVISGENGSQETIEAGAVGLVPDYTNALREYQEQNAGSFWMKRLQDSAPAAFSAEQYVWDEEKLRAEFDSLSIVTAEIAKSDGVLLDFDGETGYFLKDGNRGRLDTRKAYDYLKSCLSQGETVINLVSGNCYYDRKDTLQDREQRELWEKICAFSDCRIVYDMGEEKIPLTADITNRFLERNEAEGSSDPGSGLNLVGSMTADEEGSLNSVGSMTADEEGSLNPESSMTADEEGRLNPESNMTADEEGSLNRGDSMSPGVSPALDEEGCLIISEEKVRSWVEQLAEQYDTCKTDREFLSTRGDVVTVKYGTYGTKIDVEKEVAYLMKAMQERRTETEVHIPAYRQKGYVRGLDDIGDTYIEVDMTGQHLYFYLEGELALDTDIVTGDVSRRRETPEGIYYVYSKQRNRILRGADYASFVKYWMPVVGGVGLHDASWRRKFGEEIYKKDGSHGCINMPSEEAAKLYEMTEKGMPVIMFY